MATPPQPAIPQVVYVSFSAEINPTTTETLLALLSQQANQGVREVYLLMSTPGGMVMNGLNLFNVLRGMPFRLITHNVGNVDSIGNVIFLAGDPRYACPNSTFMFHGVGFDVQQARLEEKILRERLETILSDQRRMGAVIRSRTRLTDEEIASFFREAQVKDATFAAGCGIVNEIRDVQIPQGAPVYSLVFQR